MPELQESLPTFNWEQSLAYNKTMETVQFWLICDNVKGVLSGVPSSSNVRSQTYQVDNNETFSRTSSFF